MSLSNYTVWFEIINVTLFLINIYSLLIFWIDTVGFFSFQNTILHTANIINNLVKTWKREDLKIYKIISFNSNI